MSEKTKTIIKYIVLLAITIAGAYFYAFVPTYKLVNTVGSINTNEEVVIDFTCAEAKVSEFKVGFEYVSGDKEGLEIVLSDTNGKVIAGMTKKISDIENDGYFKIKFDKIKQSKNMTFKLSLKTKTAGSYLIKSIESKAPSFRLETMIVFILCIAYLVALAKALSWMFRK